MQTDFIVRCSGRLEYTSALIGAVILSYLLMRLHNWVSFPIEAILLFVWLVTAISIVISFIKAKIQYIEVNSEGIMMHTGLFNKKTTYVPYKRITNVGVHKNFLERFLKLGCLQIDTAGTNMVEISMRNIPSKYLDRIVRATHKNIGQGKGS